MALTKSSVLAIVLLSSAMLQLTQQASLPDLPYYVAGVVEFRPANGSIGNSAQQVEDNLVAYEDIIASADAAETDILVFPESTLNSLEEATFVPDPNELIIPCSHANTASVYHPLLIRLSCAAAKTAKYVVINLTEKEKCSANAAFDPRPCAADDLNIYNTDVVFDREGAVISRYRKVNLYGEPRNTTYEPGYGIFDTDFGVRFGHFVCFDILFYTPAQEMVDKLGITDFIFPTMWFSQLPFLTGVQFQFAWSYGNDVNFLAAGASRPAVGNTGSGIYAGKQGSLVAVMHQDEGRRQLYVAQVPKRVRTAPTRGSMRNCSAEEPKTRSKRHLSSAHIWLKRDYLELYHSVIVDLASSTHHERELCYGEFCCSFDLRWRSLNLTNSQYYTYRLGVYQGWRKEAAADTNQIKNCAVFACIGTDIMDCGKTFPADITPAVQPQVVFEQVQIEADYPTTSHSLLMPNSLKDDLLPVAVGDFDWQVASRGSMRHVRYTLNASTSNLLAFSIYGNYYDGIDDCQTDVKPGDGGAMMMKLSLFVFLMTFLVMAWQ